MAKRRPTLQLVQDVVDDSKALWDRRVPYPIESGARRVTFSHLWNEDRVDGEDLAVLQREVDQLTVAVDRLLALKQR